MAWTTVDEIEQYRRDLAIFFKRLSTLSEQNQPPHANAANGYFVTAVKNDQEIKSVVPPRAPAYDAEAQQIFAALLRLEQGILKPFSERENHSGSWKDNFGLALKAVEAIGPDIEAIAKAIPAVIKLDPTAVNSIVDGIKKAANDIHNTGIGFEGTNANGFIQNDVKAICDEAVKTFAAIKAGAKDAFAITFIESIVDILNQISNIKQENNDPWLYASWQLSFQAITGLGALRLYALRP